MPFIPEVEKASIPTIFSSSLSLLLKSLVFSLFSPKSVSLEALNYNNFKSPVILSNDSETAGPIPKAVVVPGASCVNPASLIKK